MLRPPRPPSLDLLDIWVARRASKHAPFGAPENVGVPINSAADDFCPSPMRNGWFFFVSSRPGGCGGADIYVTRKEHDVWEAPLHLNCSVNSPSGEASPYLLERGGSTWLYFSSDRPGGFAPEVSGPADADIYVSELGRFGFGHAQLVPGLNTASNDVRPNLRRDGLEIVFDSTRSGTFGGPDIYTSTRTHGNAWEQPVNLGSTINSAVNETRASLSWDGRTLVFGSNRPGSEPGPTGAPSNDVYVSSRAGGNRGDEDDD